jgi:hypothetical protein
LEGRVLRVIDGDTITIAGGETIRLLGIDTPEIGQPFASEAKWFTHALVAHKTVRLQTDAQLRDSYYRLLAFVYVETDDGWVCVNAEIVRAGLAKLLFIPPNGLYYGYFEDVLTESMVARRGMWGAIPGALSVEELECDLVDCATEVVTVWFTVDAVETTRRGTIVRAVGSEYGFHLVVPPGSEAAATLAPSEEWIGRCLSATGVLECDVREGPSITVSSASQLRFDCVAEPSEPGES